MKQRVIKGALVECTQCGVQRVLLADLVLRVGMHDGNGEIRFRCKGCDRICLSAIGSEQTTSIACTDIVIEWWEPSPELDERPDGPSFADADVLEWSALLADDTAFHDVVSTLSSAFS